MRFIRKNGRVIPIREEEGSGHKAAGAATAVAGAGLAADAARTQRVLVDASKGLTIDRKKFAFQPFQSLSKSIGTSLHLSKDGKKAAVLRFFKGGEPGEMGVSWLRVKKAMRGKGLSREILKPGAQEMRAQGGKFVYAHVVHPNSATIGAKDVPTEYWRELKSSLHKPTSEKTALRHVSAWRGEQQSWKKLGYLGQAKENILDAAKKLGIGPGGAFKETNAPAIFRHSRLTGKNLAGSLKPFRTGANKAQLAIGAALLVGGTVAALRKGKKREH